MPAIDFGRARRGHSQPLSTPARPASARTTPRAYRMDTKTSRLSKPSAGSRQSTYRAVRAAWCWGTNVRVGRLNDCRDAGTIVEDLIQVVEFMRLY